MTAAHKAIHFDKMCQENKFLTHLEPAMYKHLKSNFVSNNLDEDDLVAILVDAKGETRAFETIKKIVYETFEKPYELKLPKHLEEVFDEYTDLINTNPRKFLDLCPNLLNVNEFAQTVALFKEVGIIGREEKIE